MPSHFFLPTISNGKGRQLETKGPGEGGGLEGEQGEEKKKKKKEKVEEEEERKYSVKNFKYLKYIFDIHIVKCTPGMQFY